MATDRQQRIRNATLYGSGANLGLLVFKLVAGILGHSSAMIADAVHSASDFVTDIIVLLFVRISGKPQDCDHEYGHGKYETLATSIIGLILAGVGIGLFWEGTTKIVFVAKGGTLPSPGIIALTAAVVSIVVKEWLYRYTIKVGKATGSKAVIANAWHHRSDAFSSIAATLGIGGAMLFGGSWVMLDPLAAVIVSILIVKVALSLFIPSINELLEKSLPEEIKCKVIETVESFPEVSDIHKLRTRSIGQVRSLEFHIRMDGNMTVRDSHLVTKHIEARLHDVLGPETFINIHVEPAK